MDLIHLLANSSSAQKSADFPVARPEIGYAKGQACKLRLCFKTKIEGIADDE